MTDWKDTQGTVLEAYIGPEGHREPDELGPAEAGRQYFPVVVYSYLVGGRQYVSERWAQHRFLMSWRRVERIVRRYPVGSAVTVTYQASNPANAFLVRGWGRTIERVMVCTVVGVLAALAVMATCIILGTLLLP